MANESKREKRDTSDGSADGASTDEAIGRPGEWRGGRYQRGGAPVDQSVIVPAGESSKEPPLKDQRPVTRKDYE